MTCLFGILALLEVLIVGILHTVKLTSAAGEVSAFSTTDGEFVAEVLSALNQAMVSNRPN